MGKPVIFPRWDCLKHWDTIPCMGCLYEAQEWRHVGSYWWWRLRQPFRALAFRLFARFEYEATEGETR